MQKKYQISNGDTQTKFLKIKYKKNKVIIKIKYKNKVEKNKMMVYP